MRRRDGQRLRQRCFAPRGSDDVHFFLQVLVSDFVTQAVDGWVN